jgi:hypothetical protein
MDGTALATWEFGDCISSSASIDPVPSSTSAKNADKIIMQ